MIAYKKIAPAMSKEGKYIVKALEKAEKLHLKGKDDDAIKVVKRLKKNLVYLKDWTGKAIGTTERQIKILKKMV